MKLTLKNIDISHNNICFAMYLSMQADKIRLKNTDIWKCWLTNVLMYNRTKNRQHVHFVWFGFLTFEEHSHSHRFVFFGLILVCPHLITPIINQLNKQKRQRVYWPYNGIVCSKYIGVKYVCFCVHLYIEDFFTLYSFLKFTNILDNHSTYNLFLCYLNTI